MIKVEHLSLTLASEQSHVNILRDLTFSIDANETIGLTGPSGSGKTSLLLLLAGLERPSAGHIRFMDQDLGALSEQQLAALRLQHIGIVFQNFHLVPRMQAWENVALPLELAGQEKSKARAMALLDELGLRDRAHHYPGELSGGEQQRVAIARAMITKPRLILADEPTGNLDQETGAHVVDLLFSLRSREKSTLILITHDPQLAKKCGRLMQIKDGRLLNGGTSIPAADLRDPGFRN